MTNDMIQFDLPKNQSSIIKVLGVGGGGSNAVNHMFSQGIEGVDFIVCNTDSQALDMSPVPNKIQLGVSLTEGRGAGSIPEVGKNAAIEDIERIHEFLENATKMVFITAGMGGGTGTGAAPVIAKKAKEMGILTVAIVTIPFNFEGRKRRQQAEEGIRELKQHVDTLLLISNDRLRELYGNLSVSDAFGKADNVLTTAAKGIAEIITLSGKINVDFADVKTVMSNSGVAIMGSGTAEGENRAMNAVEMALSSPLLNDNHIRGAKNILLNITSGTDEILMDEIIEITDYIQSEAGATAEIIWGLGHDEQLGKSVSVTLVATGFDSSNILDAEIGIRSNQKKVHTLNPENETKQTKEENVLEVEGMKLFTRTETAEPQSEIANTNHPETKAPVFDFSKEIHSTNTNAKTPDAEPGKHQEDFTRSIFTGQGPLVSPVSENELQQKMRERESRLRELSVKIKSPEGLHALEKQPAFVRRNVTLNRVPASSESQVSRYTLQEDGGKVQIKSNNSFLHDNVD